ncbi:class I SAM-dependent methyltransferase [Paenibacillus xylaniclasticus]|uniref:class I SAM-dependent methyltransferase n=1 Tax=Paenibacillus xylaniclasticus TaxID=588083 RepID=UPI0013E0DBE9|nr:MULTISPECIES: methyltransferase domain-containing protein [Paenibacillus]GFN32989.1 hypothetical protein PCURB6_32490 [Paenibacillus curdlanolyticus]
MIPVNESSELFDQMLTITTEWLFELENELLLQPLLKELTLNYPCPAVLDVGSGNGAYLSLLSCYYPQLYCVGLEKDPLIFHYAQQKEKAPGLRFLPIAYESYESDKVYDLIIVRLAALHLANREHFAQWLRRRTRPGSAIVIIDVDDSCIDPNGATALPLFHSLYLEARRKLSVSTLMRFQDVLSIELTYAGFRRDRLETYRIEGRTRSMKQSMRAYMELVTLMYGHNPYEPERMKEWDDWMADPFSHYTIGMFGLVLLV